jgi:hypothetical protein
MATVTIQRDPLTSHQRAAIQEGYDRGYTHAAYVDAYGGDPHAEPDVPGYFADVPTYYGAGYTDGADAYYDDPELPS